MKMLFRPEFLNRIDDIVLFTPLQKAEVYKIIEHAVAELEGKLKDRHISLKATEDAKELILNESYSLQYGARPVKRFIQSEVETQLSREIIKGSIMDDDKLRLDVEDGKLVIVKE